MYSHGIFPLQRPYKDQARFGYSLDEVWATAHLLLSSELWQILLQENINTMYCWWICGDESPSNPCLLSDMSDVPRSTLPVLVMGREPGERIRFNLNFVHIHYNNEIAGRGFLTVMLQENWISVFSQVKYHSDSISFFPAGKVCMRIIFIIYFNYCNCTSIKTPLRYQNSENYYRASEMNS